MSRVAAASVPEIRRRVGNDVPIRPEGDYVLYWMSAFRRLHWNFALDHAAQAARKLGKPLVVLEALRCGYPWASDRLHRFVLDGMVERQRRLRSGPARYYPHVEERAGAGRGLLAALASRACLVVGDDWPGFFHPQMLAAASRIPARLELVDAAGLLPVRAALRPYPTAHGFRRLLQNELPAHLAALPEPDPLKAPLPGACDVPGEILERWPEADLTRLAGPGGLGGLPIEHAVPPVDLTGGTGAARARLAKFLAHGLRSYADHRNDPTEDAASGLSPYLHFGHIGVHEVLHSLAEQEGWSPERLTAGVTGRREGWWGMSRGAEAFLDELVTWRELGLNAAALESAYDRYESVPAWARKTLEEHEADPRTPCYGRDELIMARTHDALWNAAQRQLVRDGTIQGYLRMLWGKKILEWSPTPPDALDIMIDLNNRFALDGRDPNSSTGILWCLGKFDRPWGPERPVFGTVRYMSSANTARKFKVAGYLERYSETLEWRILKTDTNIM